MGKIINIDNGGTLTDFCVMDESGVYHAKTLTTPYDLSQCFFEGIAKVSEKAYGEKSATKLLRETDYVRYSTTLGTNAIVERKGPRIGLITNRGAFLESLTADSPESEALFASIIGNRIGYIDLDVPSEQLETLLVYTLNEVSSLGAVRIVISLSCDDFFDWEKKLIRIAQRKFPSHLLGAVPVVTASGVSIEPDLSSRTWTALFNAYLHPAMERFLYSADHRLKASKSNNPLLIFRNDGGAARVAKTTAIKTYSSGPRGGLEGVKALAEHYGLERVISYDIGGTTTDIGMVENGIIRGRNKGDVEGVSIALPLADIRSEGVGGSSVIKLNGKDVAVGPESVGAAPGPACFGLGGRDLTITDVAFMAGILSAETFFGGELTINVEKSREVIAERIAQPLGIREEQAINLALDAWAERVVSAIQNYAELDAPVTLVAFGGAGALLVTTLAEKAGVSRVIIPGLAAVFSACGIGFSDLSHEYESPLDGFDKNEVSALADTLTARAKTDMFAEGVAIEECELTWRWQEHESDTQHTICDITSFAKSVDKDSYNNARLMLKVTKRIKRHTFTKSGDEAVKNAEPDSMRAILNSDGTWSEVAVYRLEQQTPGMQAAGPAILEEEYFTGRIDAGWSFQITANRDVLIEKV